jgi:hypothetical protein
MKVERCQAVAKSGKPCAATVVDGQYCAWHSPQWAEKRRQWAAEGGRRRSNAARAKKQMPESMAHDELLGFVSLSIKGVLAGRVEPGVGNAIANLARAFVTVAGVAEFEQQLAELRRDVADIAERRRA